MAISSIATGTHDPGVQTANSETTTSTTETTGCKSPRRHMENNSQSFNHSGTNSNNSPQDEEHLSPESDPKQDAKKMRKGSKSSLSCEATSVDNDASSSTNTTSDNSVGDNDKNNEKKGVHDKSDHESKENSQDLKIKNDSSTKNEEDMTNHEKCNEKPTSSSNNNNDSNNNNETEDNNSTSSTVTTNTTSTTTPQTSSTPPPHPSTFLPSYLENVVQHSHEDFFISPYFDPRLIAQLMMEGFLPISTNKYLLPKLHDQRCVIYPLDNLHTSKSTRKKMKKFDLTVNQDFDGVVKGCHVQHGVCWLYPKIVSAFRTLHESQIAITVKQTNNGQDTQLHGSTLSLTNNNTPCTKTSNKGQSSSTKVSKSNKTETTSTPTSNYNNNNNIDYRTNNNNNNNNTNNKTKTIRTPGIKTSLLEETTDETSSPSFAKVGECPLRLYSIEVWNSSTGELAGGELGYTVGNKIYTSLTGFVSQDSAGSVQLAALGGLLKEYGFEMWDLGMCLDYKLDLGAENLERREFVRHLHRLRSLYCEEEDVVLTLGERRNCKTLSGR